MKILKRLWPVVLMIVAYVGVAFLSSVVSVSMRNRDMFLLLIIVSLGALALFIRIGNRYRIELFNLKTLTWKTVGLSIGIFFLSRFGMTFLIDILPQETFKNQDSIEQMFRMSNVWWAFIAIVIVGPIIEEVFFRRVLIMYLFEEYAWVGLILSTVLFSLAHGATTLTEFVVYGYMGLIFGITYMLTKSLECAILVHMLNNVLSFSVMAGWIR
ncbi:MULTISPECIES: CPBP family intramembrane glutamic endopeptidase [unclassified Granulicatella]|uniref:CPBP family intramembrane glutamic endopeptidase n=1 Tax=unclassified Granulicatella TaxID=2630493 RepID=UPI0010733E2E|nr:MULTISPECIES: type II CAAX endopeptidase family protein [unclassified Granulicatella]MBF0781022.1 CPBP family intramembrane metalloprotease [Granulicatella sp. 19428wC4_WM01]TFU92577.1 CPBP family intramembrane metalloprotease [Granulicatella sp. WM01]